MVLCYLKAATFPKGTVFFSVSSLQELQITAFHRKAVIHSFIILHGRTFLSITGIICDVTLTVTVLQRIPTVSGRMYKLRIARHTHARV